MYNSRVSIGSRARESHFFKTGLGNTTPRYNSDIHVQRKKYVISSTYYPNYLAAIAKTCPSGCAGLKCTIGDKTTKIIPYSTIPNHHS